MNQKRETFHRLYNPIHDRFVRYCQAKAYGNYPYEDLINDTVLVAYEKLDGLKEEGAFLHFLFGISRHLLSNNRKRKYHTDQSLEGVHEIPSEGLSLEQLMDVEILYQCIHTLPKEQADAIILYEVSGFPVKEVADIQGTSVSSVKSRLKRGRDKLAGMLEEKEQFSPKLSVG